MARFKKLFLVFNQSLKILEFVGSRRINKVKKKLGLFNRFSVFGNFGDLPVNDIIHVIFSQKVQKISARDLFLHAQKVNSFQNVFSFAIRNLAA